METIRVRKLNHANLHIQCDSGTAQELNEFFSFYVPGYKFMPAFRNRMWGWKDSIVYSYVRRIASRTL